MIGGEYMAVYLIMLICSCFFMQCEQLGNDNVLSSAKSASRSVMKKFFVLMSFFSLFFVSAIRYNVGTDYPTYFNLFTWIYEKRANYVEVGYRLLNLLIHYFTNNPQWIFVITSFIILIFFYLTVCKYSSDKCLSIFLFITMGFYFYSLNLIRQYIAVSISFYAQKFIRKNEFISFLFLIIFACLFHKSVLIMIPLYFMLRLRLKLSYYIVLQVFAIVLTLFHKPVLNLMFNFIYSGYAESHFMEYHFSTYNIIVSFMLTFGCLIYYKKMMLKRDSVILINASIFTLILYLMFGWLGIFVSRISVYLSVYHILTIPEIINCEISSKRRCFYRLCVYSVFLVFCLLLFKANNGKASTILPYQTIFTKG